MEATSSPSRTELWEKIYSIVSLIPRAKVKGDAVDASSATTAIEQMLNAEYLPSPRDRQVIKESYEPSTSDVMDYIKKRWEQIEATIKRNNGDGFQVYRTGVEDGVEFSKPYELPTEEEMVKVIRAWDDYYLAYDDEYPAMEAHKALAKAITNLLKEKS